MAILEKTVLVRVGLNTDSHYENLGYVIPKRKDKQYRMKVPVGTKIEVRIEDLLPNSNALVIKICDFCGSHSEKPQKYNDIIKQRESSSDGKDYCNQCKGIKISETMNSKPIPDGKSLLEKYPEIAKEWHPTKNDKNPSDVYAASNSYAWWLCPKGHEDYEMEIAKRTVDKNNCPKCGIEKISGKNHYRWNGGLTPINIYLRELLIEWKRRSMEKSKYKCVITGDKFDDIHHLYSFDLIVKETIEKINLNIRERVQDYSEEDLELLTNKFIEIHSKYPLGVCLREDIHLLFHRLYGFGGNKPEQFEHFKERYFKGEYDNVTNFKITLERELKTWVKNYAYENNISLSSLIYDFILQLKQEDEEQEKSK